MKLILFLVQQSITTYAEIKELPKIQQKQVAVELKAYLGKTTTIKDAFDGECMANYWQVAAADDPEKMLYDFWEINSDSGGVFHANTIEETGVEMIQGSFGLQAKFSGDQNAALLADALTDAERTKPVNKDYEFNEMGEVIIFKSDELIPTDAKQWNKFLKNQKVSEGLVRKYGAAFNKACWSTVCERVTLSETFILAFANKINWAAVSQYQQLSEDFIRQQQGRLDWTKVSFHQKLSENFMREFQEMLNWDYLSMKQIFSEAFMREFADKISWVIVSWSQPMSDDFIREFQDNIKWEHLCTYKKLSEEMRRNFSPKFDWNTWLSISRSQVLSDAFIHEFADSIQWSGISMNLYLTDEQLRLYQDKLNWRTVIVFGRSMSEALLKEFEHHISVPEPFKQDIWIYVLKNKKKFALSETFKQEILNKIKERE
jgi:hypothetical protein